MYYNEFVKILYVEAQFWSEFGRLGSLLCKCKHKLVMYVLQFGFLVERKQRRAED